MKTMFTIFVLAGASGAVMHAGNISTNKTSINLASEPIEHENFNIDVNKLERKPDTFIITPYKQCVINKTNHDNNLINIIDLDSCINEDRKWLKAI